MGHGASTNTKKFRIESNDVIQSNDVMWNRSNSDGCIVETLNLSRTKVDLLEQQVDEYRDLLQQAEDKYGKAQKETQRFNKLLSETESTKLELMDRMEDLEDEINDLRSRIESDSAEELSRILQEKDQEIESLQANVEKLSRDIKVVKSKCKERLKAMKSKLVESKQDYSMQIYQMREELKVMKEERMELSDNQRPSSPSFASDKPGSTHTEDDSGSPADPRNELIVELSNQLSQQEILILDLNEKLRIKDDLLQSKSVSSLAGTRSFSAGDKGRTTHVKGTSSISRDQCNSRRETDEQQSKGYSSRWKSGTSRDSNISQKSKNIDLEAESYNPLRSPGLVSAKSLKSIASSSYSQKVDRYYSERRDVTIVGADDSSRTDRQSASDVHSAASSREHSGNSLHRSKKHQNKLRELSPLVRVKNESLPGPSVNLKDDVTSRGVDDISLKSGILSLDSHLI